LNFEIVNTVILLPGGCLGCSVHAGGCERESPYLSHTQVIPEFLKIWYQVPGFEIYSVEERGGGIHLNIFTLGGWFILKVATLIFLNTKYEMYLYTGSGDLKNSHYLFLLTQE
jgi:hypothetical protein